MLPVLLWWLLRPAPCPVNSEDRYAAMGGHYVCDRAGGCTAGQDLELRANSLVLDGSVHPVFVPHEEEPVPGTCAVLIILGPKPALPFAVVRTADGVGFGLGQTEHYLRRP